MESIFARICYCLISQKNLNVECLNLTKFNVYMCHGFGYFGRAAEHEHINHPGGHSQLSC